MRNNVKRKVLAALTILFILINTGCKSTKTDTINSLRLDIDYSGDKLIYSLDTIQIEGTALIYENYDVNEPLHSVNNSGKVQELIVAFLPKSNNVIISDSITFNDALYYGAFIVFERINCIDYPSLSAYFIGQNIECSIAQKYYEQFDKNPKKGPLATEYLNARFVTFFISINYFNYTTGVLLFNDMCKSNCGYIKCAILLDCIY